MTQSVHVYCKHDLNARNASTKRKFRLKTLTLSNVSSECICIRSVVSGRHCNESCRILTSVYYGIKSKPKPTCSCTSEDKEYNTRPKNKLHFHLLMSEIKNDTIIRLYRIYLQFIDRYASDHGLHCLTLIQQYLRHSTG